MAAKLTRDLHERIAIYAYGLSLHGKSVPYTVKKVAEHFERAVDEKTIDRMLAEERTRHAEEIDDLRADATATFVAEQRAFYDECWRRMAPKLTANQAAGLMRQGMQASRNIAEALGVFVERVDITSGGQGLIREYVGVDVDQV